MPAKAGIQTLAKNWVPAFAGTSGEGSMSDDDFLQRWSRRKQEAQKPAALPAAKPAPKVAAKAEPEFDVTTLPPLESINALTDITAFLQKGVPAELARAALRRVWTADPAIRDFVGLAENAWDFTDPAAMPGFGPLEATDEVRQMIAQVVRQIGQAAQPVESKALPGHVEVAENSSDSNAIIPLTGVHNPATKQDEAGEETAQDLGNQVLPQSIIENTAVQHDRTEAQEKPQQLSRRTHGGALPR
jgi:Protein of unknown function (DUF3306)